MKLVRRAVYMLLVEQSATSSSHRMQAACDTHAELNFPTFMT